MSYQQKQAVKAATALRSFDNDAHRDNGIKLCICAAPTGSNLNTSMKAGSACSPDLAAVRLDESSEETVEARKEAMQQNGAFLCGRKGYLAQVAFSELILILRHEKWRI
eukprot:TRINITY_DN50042_c0_g1_i1.p1 TRINITY_DN50042_c0_g1~~TRINITY_DN50042_c0_g1_i1.p1  ORF type:complete len:109 (+),score=15.75 TRINITY_DN50042_c0_g1_i1:151-477(+)